MRACGVRACDVRACIHLCVPVPVCMQACLYMRMQACVRACTFLCWAHLVWTLAEAVMVPGVAALTAAVAGAEDGDRAAAPPVPDQAERHLPAAP